MRYVFLAVAVASTMVDRLPAQMPAIVPLRLEFRTDPADLEMDAISGAVVLRDGSLLLGDPTELHVKRVAAGGLVSVAWGRSGEGPGEFRNIRQLMLVGDSIGVADSRLLRVQFYSPAGQYLGALVYDNMPTMRNGVSSVVRPLAFTRTGSRVDHLAITAAAGIGDAASPRVGDEAVAVYDATRSGYGPMWLGRAAQKCSTLLAGGINFPVPFCASGLAEAMPDGSGVVVVRPRQSRSGWQDYELVMSDPASGKSNALALPQPTRQVSPAEWDSVTTRLAGRIERFPQIGAELARMRRQGRRLPAYLSVIPLQEGAVAVLAPDARGKPRWLLWDGSTSARLIPLAIGEQPVAGTRTVLWTSRLDEDGAIGLSMYRIGAR